MSKKELHSVSVTLIALSIVIAIFIGHGLAQVEFQAMATLQSPEPQSNGEMGGSRITRAVAISGDIIVVGEYLADVEGLSSAGRAHLFDSDGNFLMTLQSPEPDASGEFGLSLAISGDVIALGEKTEVEVRDEGSVYVFDSDGNHRATLESPEPVVSGFFGYSVDVSGDFIVVGELHGEAEGIYHAGRAYIFDSAGNLLVSFQSPEPVTNGRFGYSVAVSGDIVAVGEVHGVATGYTGGKAYLFDAEGNFLTTLQSPDPDTSSNFGLSLDIDGDKVVVGEPWADVDGESKAGRAYVFDIDGNLLETFQSPEPQAGAELGMAVAIGGGVVVVGEPDALVEVTSEGKVYLFDLAGNLLETLQSPEHGANANFGASVDISGDTVIIGEPGAEVEGESKAGRAYIFGPGPGAEPEAEPEPVSPQEEAKPVAEEKKPSGGIPGFPYESIIIGLVIGAFAFRLIRREH